MRRGRRAMRTVGGFGLLVAGVPLLLLPGPGSLSILLGLALLAGEYPWARRLLDRVRGQAARARARLPRFPRFSRR